MPGHALTLAAINQLGPISADQAVALPAFSHIRVEDWAPLSGSLRIYVLCTDFPQPPSCGPVHAVWVASVQADHAVEFLARHNLSASSSSASGVPTEGNQ